MAFYVFKEDDSDREILVRGDDRNEAFFRYNGDGVMVDVLDEESVMDRIRNADQFVFEEL